MSKEIIRDNMIKLPFSLHDARITRIFTQEDKLLLEFQEGYFKVFNGEGSRTDKSWLEITNLDWDFSYVYILNFWGNEGSFTGEKLPLEKFIPGFKNMEFEIIDETYGYNKSKFSGFLYMGEEIKECNIEIYHFGDMKYILEE